MLMLSNLLCQAESELQQSQALRSRIRELESTMQELGSSADDRRKIVRKYNDLLEKYQHSEQVTNLLEKSFMLCKVQIGKSWQYGTRLPAIPSVH